MNPSTPEGRLLLAGWQPTERLRIAVERREALRSAVDGLKTRGAADSAPIVAAIVAADRLGIITAVTQDAIGRWLDASCQNPSSELTAWSATAEAALIDAVFGDPRAVLDSLPDSPDASYVRDLAERAATPSAVLHGFNGQPARNRPDVAPMSRVLVQR
jgi:hypothetical protein